MMQWQEQIIDDLEEEETKMRTAFVTYLKTLSPGQCNVQERKIKRLKIAITHLKYVFGYKGEQ